MSHSTVAEKVMAAPYLGKEVAKKWKLWEVIKSHLRRTLLEIVNLFVNHDWLFRIVGVVNKHIGLIESVFLVYPANEKYASAYAYPSRLEKNRWNPWFAGLLWQNGKLIVMFAISATNGQFTDPQNTNDLCRVTERMEELRQLFAAKRKTFAGILPGVLFSKKIIRNAPEADLTSSAVVKAIGLVKTKESLEDDTPIIVLGGKGFVGRRVVKLLGKSNVYSVDLADGKIEWDHIDRRVIVVNITLNGALKEYVGKFQPGTVIINEVYPEPTLGVLERLADKHCNCYHIVGVEAIALPSFPAAYEGGIPCCAAWPSPKMRVIVRKVT